MKLDRVFYEDCINGMRNHLPDESVHLIVTSPPYYNAREYRQWVNEEAYWEEMCAAFEQCFRVLQNHGILVLNVADVTCKRGERKWSVGKVPLVAKFTVLLTESIGFEYVDNIIWDKGEVESRRNTEPYPFYFNLINCYEGILVFHKHVVDDIEIPCPVCGKTIVQNNGLSETGVRSWECKNPDCRKSEAGRGVRFSVRSVMMQRGKTESNRIPEHIVKKWRRDIVKISPVIKITSKGENIEGHSAPFPEEIPEYAILAYTHPGDLVLDPFIGSGTTGRAARRNGIRWIGFEIHADLKKRIDKKTLRKLGRLDEYFSKK